MEYFVRIVEALAWPIAAVVIVFSFKSEIQKLLPQVRKLKAGPIEAEFERELTEIVNESEELIPDFATNQEDLSATDKIISLAHIDPRSAILEAWRNFEVSLQGAIIHNAGSPIPDTSSSFKVLKEAERMELLSPKELMVANDLRGLRNQAAHLHEFNPSKDSVYKYIELAKSLERRAKKIAEGSD